MVCMSFFFPPRSINIWGIWNYCLIGKWLTAWTEYPLATWPLLTGWKMKKAAASVFSAWHCRCISISFSSCGIDHRQARFPSSSRKRACPGGANMATNQAHKADTMGAPCKWEIAICCQPAGTVRYTEVWWVKPKYFHGAECWTIHVQTEEHICLVRKLFRLDIIFF